MLVIHYLQLRFDVIFPMSHGHIMKFNKESRMKMKDFNILNLFNLYLVSGTCHRILMWCAGSCQLNKSQVVFGRS